MKTQVPLKQPGPPPPTALCYICLEPSTINQPLLRNCTCRGDAGWAQVACLAKFAASKNTEAEQKHDPSIKSPWEYCILCKTPHMQNMALAMAKALVKLYEYLPDTNELRLASLYSLALSRSNAGDYDGALELYDRLLKLYDVLTSRGFDMRIQESHVYGKMGQVLSADQRKFNEAITKFEQQRELLVAVYGPNSPELQNNNDTIIMLKEILGIGGCGHQKGDSAAELVMARQKFKKCFMRL